jgi:hypothetical protein
VTLVRVRKAVPTPTGNVPAWGRLDWRPTRARIITGDPDTEILPEPFSTPLVEGGVDVALDPTGATWAWEVTEHVQGKKRAPVLYAVPDVTSIDFTDLAEVSPATLEPLAEPSVPQWTAYVDGLEATAADSLTQTRLARDDAAGSLAAALTAQDSAAAKAGEAAASASAAAGSVVAAAGQVTLAQGRVDAAQGKVNDAAAQVALAQGQVTLAAGQAAAAAGSAAAAQTARTGAETAREGVLAAQEGAEAAQAGAETAKAGAQTARAGAETARTGAEQALAGAEDARDAAGLFHSTTVRTGLVDAQGHLILTRNDDTSTDAGKVILPTALSIGEVVTGPETAGDVGPQGPIGPKGDPGGFTRGTDLPAGTDLDTILVDGIYRQNTTANATTALHYPVALAGILTVMTRTPTDSSYMIQTYEVVTSPTTTGASVTYKRIRANSVWYPWKAFTAARVDQTAGRAIYQWDDLNSRDQLVYGDTGWRDMWAEVLAIDPGATKIAGFYGARIRRTLHNIYLDVGFTTSLITPTDWRPALMPTASWRPDTPANWQIPAAITGSSGIIHFSPANYVRNWTAGNVILQMTLPCSATWPTSLPGTAVNTIPNT